MLYAVHKGHDDYGGGQEPIVHLVSTVGRAIALGHAWAFTDRHAELAHALHFDDLASLSEIEWPVMARKYWSEVKEQRQAEFLVRESFPWTAVDAVAVMTKAVAERAQTAIRDAAHQPLVATRPEWYY